MSYQALYRAYRPQSFSEMSGQAHVKRTLQNALLSNKTTHAYLFSGPRGTGKTSTAKIFAKALNCENGPAGEPCNECPTCISITNGSNTDVIEFDAASNSRVEEMRDIIEKVRFAPANSRYKVYIIDEVHMLSNSAFNALLKTLEEPPAHVVFILATTEPHKLPLTIISRCQRFDFKRHTTSDIISRMKEVLEDAGIPYHEPVLKVIAQAAAGGMRDALSMLDQVVSFSSGDMTVEDALLVTGSISQDAFYELALALHSNEAAKSLGLLDSMIQEGKDPVRLTEDLITFLRDLLLIQAAPDLEDLLELATSDDKFKELANRFQEDALYRYIDILTKTQQDMRFSNHAKVYLESALLKMSQAEGRPFTASKADQSVLENRVVQLEQLVRELQSALKGGVVPSAAAAEPEQPKRSKANRGFKVSAGRIQDVLKNATKEDIQGIKSQWAQILNNLQKSHAALLNEAEPVAASARAFVLKFKYDIHCQMAADNATFLTSFSSLLESLVGKTYEVMFVPEESWLKIREDFIRQNGLKKHDDQMSEEESAAEEMLSLLEQETGGGSTEDPLVSEAEKLFGKEFVEVYDD